jgi:hypothetical protein
MSKYGTLINILDQVRFEAPKEYVKYRPIKTDLEKVNQARSRALIHLYLKVSFGLLDFIDREKIITDGSYDGGIDAYFIDNKNKKIYFIQSKFRTTSKNFEEKEITFEELLKMDTDRIVDGENKDEDGNEYNGKIKQLARELTGIEDIGRYQYEVIILANVKPLKASQARRLTNGFPVQVFDNIRVYKDLVFPVITGTYYNYSQLHISLNLTNKNSSSARISYNVKTEYKNCDITVVFVPTEEIARILYKYKNSILKFNPRCYLEMQANSVNKEIYNTIKLKKTNEFALFNNGITMLSDDTSFNERIGQKDKAQIIISNPQIINGGQTAFTLSRIFEEVTQGKEDQKIFTNKEVLLKIITFGESESKDQDKKLHLIEDISKATNQQNQVSDADRRSNDKIQIDLQNKIFDKYGYYYERKKGEFSDGIKNRYIDRNLILDRELFLRLAMACELLPAQARRTSMKKIFQEDNFTAYLKDSSRYMEYFYAYTCHTKLNELERSLREDRQDRHGVSAYGQALRYGKFAVCSVCVKLKYSDENSLLDVASHIDVVLSLWLDFEKYFTNIPKNSSYFREYDDPETGIIKQDLNFEGYYKVQSLNRDIDDFFLENKS